MWNEYDKKSNIENRTIRNVSVAAIAAADAVCRAAAEGVADEAVFSLLEEFLFLGWPAENSVKS